MNTLVPTKATARQQVHKAIGELSGASIKTHDEEPWASVSFSGTRQRLMLMFEGPDAAKRSEAFAALLPNHEFAFDGYLVADAYVTRHLAVQKTAAQVSIELLLLEEQPQ